MSTEIYNGFFFNHKISTVLPILKEAKNQLTPFVENRVLGAQCWMIANLVLKTLEYGSARVNHVEMKPSNCPPGPSQYIDYLFDRGDLLSWAREMVEAHANTAENPDAKIFLDYSPRCDISLGVTLFPLGKRTYGIAHGDKELCGNFLALPRVQEFCYWNNTDAPERISAQEWDERGRIWNAILPSFYAADDGFGYTLFQARRYLFQTPTENQVVDWFNEHRQKPIGQYADSLLRIRLRELNPCPEGDTVGYCIELGKKAASERKRGTAMAVQAVAAAEEEIPTDWSGIKETILGKKGQ